MAEPCGCKADVEFEQIVQEGASLIWRYHMKPIKHCPIHAAAGDMLAALREVLAEVPPMQWLIEQGGLGREAASRHAQVIGDAYTLLEEAGKARGGVS